MHRIGRTGRAGHEGLAVSFCMFDELPYLKDIEKLIKKSVPEVTDHPYPMQVFEAEPKAERQPRPGRGPQQGQPRGGRDAREARPAVKTSRGAERPIPQADAAPRGGRRAARASGKGAAAKARQRPPPRRPTAPFSGKNRAMCRRRSSRSAPCPRSGAPRPLPLRRPGAKNRKTCCTRVPAAPGGRAEKAPARRARTASGLFAGALLTNRQIMRK